MTEIIIKRKGRGVRVTSTLTTSGEGVPPGAHITIDGFGIGARGQKIIGGRSVDTGRRAKCKTLTVFKVQKP